MIDHICILQTYKKLERPSLLTRYLELLKHHVPAIFLNSAVTSVKILETSFVSPIMQA
jgi:hypothetical protein